MTIKRDCKDCVHMRVPLGEEPCISCEAIDTYTNFENAQKGNFKPLPELELKHSYLEMLSAYDQGKLEVIARSIHSLLDDVGQLRPKGIPEAKRGFTMKKIKEVVDALNLAELRVNRLKAIVQAETKITDDPLKGE